MQHKPDISVKRSPRITRKAKRLVDQTCRRYAMFESDTLRFCLEAILPQAHKRGMAWVTKQIPGFDPDKRDNLSEMVTVRTSKSIKAMLVRIIARRQYTEAEILRYCYDAILPVALKDGFAKIMAMREKAL